ncbi:CpsB/CapC family capsule biosynthesis tyrosine phosphatase [Bacillus smithii]|uniref:tyrosine-protein phosphatase n=1 Tax=Bacillus smithii TaxID=1479 RepID=UPI003D1C7D13
MIDIHCHILPGVDDGAQTLTEAAAMAKQAEKEGIHTIIATPHHMNRKYINRKSEIVAKVMEVNAHLEREGINVTVLPGQEVRIYGEILQDYKNGEISTLGGDSSYILVEFPSGYVPKYAEQLLFDMQMKGLMPVVVHPERNQELIQDPDKLYNLVKNGAAAQITAASLTGYFGKKIQKFTEQLIEANLAHFIASDAHNTNKRPFKMLETLDRLEKEFGIDYVYYFQENAELAVSGQNIMKEPPQQIKKKKFLGLF